VDPVELFEAATSLTLTRLEGVSPDQWADPTPCSEWDVRALVDHIVGGPAYLLGALGEPVEASGADAGTYARLRERCLVALRRPGADAVRCVSPLGFEWSVGEATAGTFMDQLVHTWDLAVATGQDTRLDPTLVEACVAMFLPEMPERGRAAGLVGPAVPVPADAPAQDRLLGAKGRHPRPAPRTTRRTTTPSRTPSARWGTPAGARC
jgi:uncharacterized protein (TIGR03086 family)